MISVIIPLYNAQTYLDKCIRSVINQTYSDMEIILVNDGSIDNSLEICKKYSTYDSRIILIDKGNGGLVSARKAGLLEAKGDYIGWVDADDWIEVDYFERMVYAQKESNVDIVIAGHYHDIGDISYKVSSNIPLGIHKVENILDRMLYSGSFFEYGIQPHLVTKFIKREVLMKTQLTVDERIFSGEDAAVVYPSLLEVEEICIIDNCGYHYVQHQKSMQKTRNLDEIERYQVLMHYLSKKFKEKNVFEKIYPQFNQFQKFFLLMRDLNSIDKKQKNDSEILWPYGGINKSSHIILYGAGVLGQMIYNYLNQNNYVEIDLWVDQKFEYYQEYGLAVFSPERIITYMEKYDWIVIANTVERTAIAIKKYLLDLGVPEQKIRWFSDSFMDSENCFNILY